MNIDPRLYCYFGARRTDEILDLVEKYSRNIVINCSESDRIMIKGFKLLLEIDGKDEVVINEDFSKHAERWIDVKNITDQ